MSNLIIRKAAVLGAGVMGAQIAAHLVNARVPVVLFDLPTQPDGASGNAPVTGADKGADKNAIARKAVEHLKKLSPAPLGVKDDAQYLEVANYEDNLSMLTECDLVIEAIAERMDWKHDLYRKIAPHLAPHAIFATNTSGLSINALADGFPAELKERFCGVHFFNPPRYMHLVEVIPSAHTRVGIVDQLETFLTSTLGKGVVRANDTPNFIANRVGVFSMLATMAEAQRYGLGFDVVDDLTGSRLGRAKSATFRTADVVGLDTLAHVIRTMQDGLPQDPFSALYRIPDVLQKLIAHGALGQKSGAGFYRKEGKVIKVLDPATGEYQDATGKADELVARILKRPAAERFKLLRETTHPQTQFLWAVFRDVFHYIAVQLEEIANNARDIDFALRWGFGWNEGPFESWQMADWQQIAQWVKEDIDAGHALCKAPLPQWVFDGPVAAASGVHTATGSWSASTRSFVPRSTVPVYQRQIFRAQLATEMQGADHGSQPNPLTYGKTLFENADVRVWADTDAALAERSEVAIISFKSKMNTISPAVLEGLGKAIELAEADYRALVIWQPASLKLGAPGGPFSAGANLESALPMFMTKGAAGLDAYVHGFQQTMQRVKYAQVPVVAALSGIALGGGCELSLHCAQRVAHFETYLGLVEVGVGLLPAGGGLKEAALRAARAARASNAPDNLLPFLARSFENIALAKVSGSALEARDMGYLKDSDPIVFNVHELLDTACRQAHALALSGYRPPLHDTAISVAGRSVLATLKAQLVNMREGHFISTHDYLIGSRIAEVICGGDVEAGSAVDEDWLLDMERRAFIELIGTAKTQERIMGMLQTGKPVRN